MSHPFYHLGWFFYRSSCSHPFFQGLYRTDNFSQQLLSKTLINTTTYKLFSWKTLKKVYLFNHSNCSHPSFEVVVHLFLPLKGWQSFILWSVLCRFHLFHHCCHSLTHIVICCHTLYHQLSFFVTRCTTRCHLLSLDVCLFTNDHLSIVFLDWNNKIELVPASFLERLWKSLQS